MSSFRNVFDIIGPVMIGPSSSHTAGAARIGRVARKIFGELPTDVEFILYGSFAMTYRGHGTDVALAAGLMDFDTFDTRITQALDLAQQAGMNIRFTISKDEVPEPNTVRIKLEKGDKRTELVGVSIGGGAIQIQEVNGYKVNMTGAYPTLVIPHEDRFGVVAAVTAILSNNEINIGQMEVARQSRGSKALMVIETDQKVSPDTLAELEALPAVQSVSLVDPS